MASNRKLIEIVLKISDQMSAPAKGAAKSLENLSQNLTKLGGIMTVGITAPIVAGGVAMMQTFANFESVMAELGARTGATAEEMQRMEKFAIEMGRTTAFSATEAAQALLELTSSGSSAKEAMAQLPAVLNLAAAGALDLKQAADGVTDILAAFQLEAKQAAMVSDELARAAGASSATVTDLLQAFQNAGPVFAQFGLDVNESAAALAVLAENGIKGAEAGTQLKSMLLNMTRDTEEVAAAWTQLGVSLFDAQGNMRDIDEIFKDINKAMEGMSMEEQIRLSQDLAGSYGLVGFNALRSANGISDMQSAMLNAASAEEVAAARKNTLAGAMEQLGGAAETLGIVLGGLAKGPLVSIIHGLTGIINAISSWAEANPQLAQFVMILLGILAAVGPILIIVGQLAGAFLALQTLAAGFGVTAAVFSAAFLPVLGLIVLIAGAILLLLANWETFSTAFMQLAALIGHAWQQMFQTAMTTLGQLLSLPGLFVAAIAQGWSKLLERAGTAMSQLGTLIQVGIQSALNQAGTSFSQLGQIIWQRLSTLGNQMMILGRAIIDGLINGIKSKAVDLVAYVFGLSEELTAAIKRALGISSPSKVMMKLGRQTAEGFQKGVKSMTDGIGVNVNGRPVSGSAPSLAPAVAASGGGGNVYIGTMIMPPGTTREQVDHFNREVGRKAKIRGAKKK